MDGILPLYALSPLTWMMRSVLLIGYPPCSPIQLYSHGFFAAIRPTVAGKIEQFGEKVYFGLGKRVTDASAGKALWVELVDLVTPKKSPS